MNGKSAPTLGFALDEWSGGLLYGEIFGARGNALVLAAKLRV